MSAVAHLVFAILDSFCTVDPALVPHIVIPVVYVPLHMGKFDAGVNDGNFHLSFGTSSAGQPGVDILHPFEPL